MNVENLRFEDSDVVIETKDFGGWGYGELWVYPQKKASNHEAVFLLWDNWVSGRFERCKTPVANSYVENTICKAYLKPGEARYLFDKAVKSRQAGEMFVKTKAL